MLSSCNHHIDAAGGPFFNGNFEPTWETFECDDSDVKGHRIFKYCTSFFTVMDVMIVLEADDDSDAEDYELPACDD